MKKVIKQYVAIVLCVWLMLMCYVLSVNADTVYKWNVNGKTNLPYGTVEVQDPENCNLVKARKVGTLRLNKTYRVRYGKEHPRHTYAIGITKNALNKKNKAIYLHKNTCFFDKGCFKKANSKCKIYVKTPAQKRLVIKSGTYKSQKVLIRK